MAGKYYAVRKGTVTGIFRTWEECKKNVHGYSSAEYKSFKTLEEAEAYMKGGAVAEEVTDTVPIYVDGSYNKVTKEFSYGMVVLLKEGGQTFCESYRDEELATMHNVAGEIKARRLPCGMQWSTISRRLRIYHDYEGIAKWCLGDWKTNKEGTKAYKAFYEEASKEVSIRFQKVTDIPGIIIMICRSSCQKGIGN